MSPYTRKNAFGGQAGGDVYDTPTLAFHWLTVIMVVLLFGTSWAWNTWPHNRQWRPVLESTHVSLGILFAALIVLRALWRLTGSRRLEPEPGVPGLLSQLTHATLYTLMGLQIVLGFVLRWLQGESFSFFGLFAIPDVLERNRQLAETVEHWHNWTAWALVVVAMGHAAAALLHHFVLRDAILSRMLVQRRQSS